MYGCCKISEINKKEKATLRWFWCGLCAFLALASISTASARIVGVVVDDSGSMLRRFETPLYATQLILSVLNDDDRVFISRLSERGRVQEVDLRRRQAKIESMRRDWKAVDGTPTPYPAVETMLQTLVQEAEPGDDASLLVITDGRFEKSAPPPPAQLVESYRRIRDRFRGNSLRAFFVAFAPHGSKGDEILETIREQGVRENLLTVFNGSEDVGNVVVRDGGLLYEALRDIIAEMVEVDPAGAEDAMTRSGRELRLQAPFTVTRVVVLAPGTSGLPAPRLVGMSFGTREDAYYSPSMREIDDLTRELLSSNVHYLLPWPPLAPDEPHTLTFDKPIEDVDIRVLFETSVKVGWEVYDRKGQLLPVDAHGVLRMPAREKAEVRAFLTDTMDGRERRVDFTPLPHRPEFSLYYQGQGSPDASRMKVDQATSTAVGALHFDRPGRYTVAVSARYPGFISKRARDLTVIVEDVRPVDIEMQAYGIGVCPECTAEKVNLTYAAGTGPQDVLAVELRTNAEHAGRYELELSEKLPRGVSLLLPDGTVLSRDAELEIYRESPVRLTLQYDKEYVETAERTVVLNARAQKPFVGEARMGLRLVPRVASMSLEYAGSTLDPDGEEPLRLKVTDLDEGEGEYLKANGLLAPLAAEHIEVEGTGARFDAQVQEDTNLIMVLPREFICDCLTSSGVKRYTLRYHNPETRQSAQYEGSVDIVPVSLVARCWQETVAILLTLLFIAKAICLMRTQRFPLRSRLVMRKVDQDWALLQPRLHRFTDWLWPLCRNAERQAEVFHVRAARNGVDLLFEKGYPPTLKHVDLDESVNQLFEDNGGKPLRVRWGEMFVDFNTNNEYQFLRDSR